MEEKFDVLSEQFATLTVGNQPQNRCPNLCIVEEDFAIEDAGDHIKRVSFVDLDSPQSTMRTPTMMKICWRSPLCNQGTIQKGYVYQVYI